MGEGKKGIKASMKLLFYGGRKMNRNQNLISPAMGTLTSPSKIKIQCPFTLLKSPWGFMQIKNVLIKISLHNYAAGGQVMSRGLHSNFCHHDKKNRELFRRVKTMKSFIAPTQKSFGISPSTN